MIEDVGGQPLEGVAEGLDEAHQPPDSTHSPQQGDDVVVSVGTPTFDGFFVAHHTDLVRALTMTLGDVELGRDAAAEGFARAMPRWNKVSAYANPAGWIYRVGLNWARSRRRKTRREVAELPTDQAVTPSEPDMALAAALRALSIDHRAVVVGRYYLDWSEAQLAVALDISPGTVKSRLSRALARLAETLETPHGTI
jgi:RNA polymerase sigma-70 factor (ECF subfamily)